MAITLVKRFGGIPDIENQDSKTTPVNTDLILIEDSADNYSKKKILVGGLGGVGGGIISIPVSGGYRVTNIRLDASKNIVITYDETPAP